MISDMDLLVLNLLLEEQAQCNMGKKTGLTYPTVLQILRKLERMGFILLTRKEPSAKGGKDKHFWLITAKGKKLLSLLG